MAMDTILALLQANPARRIAVVSGTGTTSPVVTRMHSTGTARWTRGVLPERDVLARWPAIRRHERDRGARVVLHSLRHLTDPGLEHNSFGILSEDESASVKSGVAEIVRDHLTDVVDEASGSVMVLRSWQPTPARGRELDRQLHRPFRTRVAEHTPYVSASGRSMSVNSTSMTLGFSSVSAYFMAHLFFLDKLADAPLYELDFHGLRRNAPEAQPVVLCSLIMYNLSLVFERGPAKVFQGNGLDFDRWYPFPRRLAGQLRFMHNHKRDAQHHPEALDTFSRHSDVRCGPLAAAFSSS